MKWLKWTLVVIIFILIGYFGFFKIYPCKVAPVVLNPIYRWSLCSMDMFASAKMVGMYKLYFGFEKGNWLALLLNFIIAYLIVIGVKYVYERVTK